MNIFSREYCLKNSLWSGAKISGDEFCAGVPADKDGYTKAGSDTCGGDSGGPLICNHNDFAVLVGVTSWGSGDCGSEGYPGIYGNIHAYLPWIRSVVDFDDADQTTRNKPTTNFGLLPATAVDDEELCCEKNIDIE